MGNILLCKARSGVFAICQGLRRAVFGIELDADLLQQGHG
jgi:hypothetical protein